MQDTLVDAKLFELVQVQITTNVGNLICLGPFETIISCIYLPRIIDRAR